MDPDLLISKITHERTDSIIELAYLSESDKRVKLRMTLKSNFSFVDTYFLFKKAMSHLSSQELGGFVESFSEVVMPDGKLIPISEFKLA